MTVVTAVASAADVVLAHVVRGVVSVMTAAPHVGIVVRERVVELVLRVVNRVGVENVPSAAQAAQIVAM